MATVVVVEDEQAIADAVAARLRSEGLVVEVAVDGPSAVALVERVRPDLVVLVMLLPGFDGLARDGEMDLVVGLEVGADDYLTKPFSPRELVARVRALLRRAARAAEAAAAGTGAEKVGGIELDRAARRVRHDGETVHLTPTEFDLLACLAGRPGTVLTRTQLLAKVWGYRDGSGIRTVDSHVRALRRKLGDGLVRTVHGVGYSIEDEAQPEAAR